MLANLLRAEQARDVSIIDMNDCDRRDVGMYVIIATGVTARHCRRLGPWVGVMAGVEEKSLSLYKMTSEKDTQSRAASSIF